MQATAALEGEGQLAHELGAAAPTLAQLSPDAMVALALLVTVALVVIIAILLYFAFALEPDTVGDEPDADDSAN